MSRCADSSLVRSGNVCPYSPKAKGATVGIRSLVLAFLAHFCLRNNSLRKSTGNPQFLAPLEKQTTNVLHAIILSCYTPFSAFSIPCLRVSLSCVLSRLELILFDQMALLLNLW